MLFEPLPRVEGPPEMASEATSLNPLPCPQAVIYLGIRSLWKNLFGGEVSRLKKTKKVCTPLR